MVKIHELKCEPCSDGHAFEFTLKFCLSDEEGELFQQLRRWTPVSYVNVPMVHEAEVSRLTMSFHDIPGSDSSELKLEGPPVTDDWKRGYMRGYDCLSEEDGVITFHEFFMKTPVTEALVSEIEKFQDNPEHTAASSFAPMPAQYLATLLQCLFLHWD